jgi:hypothetical protein
VPVVLDVQHLEWAVANLLEIGGQVHRGGVARPDVRADKGAERVLPARGAGVEEDAAARAEQAPVLGQGGRVVGEMLGDAEVHDGVVGFVGRVLQEVLAEHPARKLLARDEVANIAFGLG